MPGRGGRDTDELLLDMILDRRPLPPDAPPGMHALAGKLVGLAAAPGDGELPGQAAALAAFVRSGSPASTLTLAGGPSPRGRGRRLLAGRARLAAGVAVLIVGVSGTAAAAYAGVLPAAVQNFAHHVIGAPAPRNAAHHRHGAPQQPGGNPGQARSPRPAHPAHPAKPGQHKHHKGRGHRAAHGQPVKKPKPSHSPRPSHPAHSPRPKAHPSQSPSPASR